MTSKDKAYQLFCNYLGAVALNTETYHDAKERAKTCALIAVNELMKLYYDLNGGEESKYLNDVQKEIECL